MYRISPGWLLFKQMGNYKCLKLKITLELFLHDGKCETSKVKIEKQRESVIWCVRGFLSLRWKGLELPSETTCMGWFCLNRGVLLIHDQSFWFNIKDYHKAVVASMAIIKQQHISYCYSFPRRPIWGFTFKHHHFNIRKNTWDNWSEKVICSFLQICTSVTHFFIQIMILCKCVLRKVTSLRLHCDNGFGLYSHFTHTVQGLCL